MQLKDKIDEYANTYCKNPDNIRESNARVRQLKPKLYNTVKSKTLSFK